MNKSMINSKIYYVVVTELQTMKEYIYEYGSKKHAIEHYIQEEFAQLYEYDSIMQKTFLVSLPIEFD